MSAAETAAVRVPWYKEPTKDQWLAWIAAWLGWTLDAFDFTIFLLIMVPISKEFNVPLTDVAFVLTITLWLRLVGAVASGWLADRVGRKLPLMLSILVFARQLHRRLFADVPVSRSLPRDARHRHGSGMARRSSPSDGDLASCDLEYDTDARALHRTDTGAVLAGAEIGAYFRTCASRGVHVGGDPEARAGAQREIAAFFKAALRLP
jgi:hypothetical protein